jgi:hypothetical protein
MWKEVKKTTNLLCTCGNKVFMSSQCAKDYEGHVLYTQEKATWTTEEIVELDKAVEHYCDDLCFFKGRHLYTCWVRGERRFNKCKSFDRLLSCLKFI